MRLASLSLKKKLLIAFMFIAFIPAAIISMFYYIDSRRALEANVGETYMILLAHILNNIEQQVEEVYQFTNWLYLEKDIVLLMERSPEEARRYDQQAISVVEKIESQFRFLPIMEHVSSFFLLGHNGLDIRYGPDSYRVDPSELVNEDWFQKGSASTGELTWGGLTKHYSPRATYEYVIPVYRNFVHIYRGSVLGSIVLLLNPTIFRQAYSGLVTEEPAALFIHDAQDRLFFSDTTGPAAPEVNWAELLPESAGTPYFEISQNGHSYLVVQSVSDRTRFRVTLITRLNELQRQRQVLTMTTVLVAAGTILLCSAFSVFLSQNLGKPIWQLMEMVDRIAAGNFEQQIFLRHRDEIGALGASINRMAQQIERLMAERVKAEQEMREAEIKLLQSQINPHFLHNTLNSIKWMAALQGADGIREMVSCLGRLLRAVMGNVNEKITIREELDLLNDYVHIQKVRYRGKIAFRYEITDSAGKPPVEECLIPKFTLQPLVENAIFHGIEPKEGSGTIVISFQHKEGYLEASVWDDGVGISQEKLGILQNLDAQVEERGIRSSIGLKNIHHRIQLIYGSEYGLSISSEEGRYTKVTITLPVEVRSDAEGIDRR